MSHFTLGVVNVGVVNVAQSGKASKGVGATRPARQMRTSASRQN